MTQERLAEIKALCDAATPGPWEVDRNFPFSSDIIGIYSPVLNTYIVMLENQEYTDYPTKPIDADFIATSRTIVPELLKEIERLRAKVIAYEKSGLFPDEVVELA